MKKPDTSAHEANTVIDPLICIRTKNGQSLLSVLQAARRNSEEEDGVIAET